MLLVMDFQKLIRKNTVLKKNMQHVKNLPAITTYQESKYREEKIPSDFVKNEVA